MTTARPILASERTAARHKTTNWADFERGMAAARKSRDLAEQTTLAEAVSAGGPDFLAGEDTDESPDWHRGYDHAINLARTNAG